MQTYYTARRGGIGWIGIVYTWNTQGDQKVILWRSEQSHAYRGHAIADAAAWCKDNWITAELA